QFFQLLSCRPSPNLGTFGTIISSNLEIAFFASLGLFLGTLPLISRDADRGTPSPWRAPAYLQELPRHTAGRRGSYLRRHRAWRNLDRLKEADRITQQGFPSTDLDERRREALGEVRVGWRNIRVLPVLGIRI